MGKIAGKVPKLQEKLFDFPYFRQKFDRLFLSPYITNEMQPKSTYARVNSQHEKNNASSAVHKKIHNPKFRSSHDCIIKEILYKIMQITLFKGLG